MRLRKQSFILQAKTKHIIWKGQAAYELKRFYAFSLAQKYEKLSVFC